MTTFAEVRTDLDRADLRLRRAWPRAADQLLLDLDDTSSGDRVAAQWFADAQAAERVVAATEGATRRGRVVLHHGGADRRLRGLASLLRRPGSRLVAHRPERRAVVALDDGARFAKLVPARKLGALRHGSRRASRLPIRTPTVTSADTDPMVVTGALPGTGLPELLAGPRYAEALRAVGAAVARLHRCAPPAGSGLHGPQDELAVTQRWERWARTYGIDLPADGQVDAGSARSATAVGPPPELRLIHRDLHDGQFLLTTDTSGRFTDHGVGLLDFDLAVAGDPALDLANLIEHLWLRGRQGVVARPADAVRALLSGYDPDQDLLSRAACYRALTARRLAALYSFRAADLLT